MASIRKRFGKCKFTATAILQSLEYSEYNQMLRPGDVDWLKERGHHVEILEH